MKKLRRLGGLLALSLFIGWCSIGCKPSDQQNAAKASLQVTNVLQAAQDGEIAAHNQKLLSDEDHQFIQRQFITLAEADKATNLCISQAANKGAVINCLNTAVNTVDGINKEGGTFIKNPNTQATFNLTLTSVKSILQTIIAVMGGQ